MRWITRRNAHVDRTSCPWLIRRFIDPEAAFFFVPADADPAALDGHTFDMRGAEYGHEGARCTFEVMLARHDLHADPALVEMGRIIRDADVPPSRSRRPEGAGLDAIIRGFQRSVPDDHEKLRLTAPLYDALYAYCQAKVVASPPKQGTPRPRLSYSRRVATHFDEDESGRTNMTRTVLFVCPHGAAKSRIAAAYFSRVAPPGWHATTAGQEPDAVVSATAERLLAGEEAAAFLDRSSPRPIDAVPAPARIVGIDCDVPGAATRWTLRHRTFDAAMRDELRDRAEGLAIELSDG